MPTHTLLSILCVCFVSLSLSLSVQAWQAEKELVAECAATRRLAAVLLGLFLSAVVVTYSAPLYLMQNTSEVLWYALPVIPHPKHDRGHYRKD